MTDRWTLLAGALVMLAPLRAAAHIEMTQPAQRYPAASQFELEIKQHPCGLADNPPGEVPRTTYQAGETITVKWDEYVPHPGHFRIAFDSDGDDDLLDPAGYDDLNTPGVEILADGIPHEDGKSLYEAQVTLPDVTCDNCTLQLIQVMTDKPPWGPAGGDDIYYQCADLILEPAGGSGGTDGSGGGSSSGDSSSSGTGGGSGDGTSGGGSGTSAGTSGDGSTTGGTDGTGTSDAGSGGDTDGDGGGGGGGCRAHPRIPPAGWALCGLGLLGLAGRFRRRASVRRRARA